MERIRLQNAGLQNSNHLVPPPFSLLPSRRSILKVGTLVRFTINRDIAAGTAVIRISSRR